MVGYGADCLWQQTFNDQIHSKSLLVHDSTNNYKKLEENPFLEM